MTILQTIHHKKNEIQAEEFFKDKECTEAFDFTNAKNLYIAPVNGDVTPIITLDANPSKIKVYTGYCPIMGLAKTLDDITPNLSKYIPEDNAVLFLSEQDMEKYKDCFPNNHISLYTNDGSNDETFIANNFESLISGIVEVKKGNTTIFLPHGTQSEIQKANEVAKELKEQYGVEEVNLFVLHCFYDDGIKLYQLADFCNKLEKTITQNEVTEPLQMYDFNKIITTNSTGILKREDSKERLQIIDAKEIFEEYLNENNLI